MSKGEKTFIVLMLVATLLLAVGAMGLRKKGKHKHHRQNFDKFNLMPTDYIGTDGNIYNSDSFQVDDTGALILDKEGNPIPDPNPPALTSSTAQPVQDNSQMQNYPDMPYMPPQDNSGNYGGGGSDSGSGGGGSDSGGGSSPQSPYPQQPYNPLLPVSPTNYPPNSVMNPPAPVPIASLGQSIVAPTRSSQLSSQPSSQAVSASQAINPDSPPAEMELAGPGPAQKLNPLVSRQKAIIPASKPKIVSRPAVRRASRSAARI